MATLPALTPLPSPFLGVAHASVIPNEPDPSTGILRISASPGQDSFDDSDRQSISGDGRFIVFQSSDTDLVPDSDNFHVYLYDRATGEVDLAARTSAGGVPNGQTEYPDMSADGRFIVFDSYATNLLPEASSGEYQVFLRDRITGAYELISVTPAGLEGNNTSDEPRISPNGRFVPFSSRATDLVPGVTGTRRLYLRDRELQTTQLVDVGIGGAAPSASASDASVSNDGRWVTFTSRATNLVSNPTLTGFPVHSYLRDMSLATTKLLADAGGSVPNGNSLDAHVSADGAWAAFTSQATNVAPAYGGPAQVRILLHNVVSGQIEAGIPVAGDLFNPRREYQAQLSSDARFVGFVASNVDALGQTTQEEPYVYDRTSGSITNVAKGSAQGVFELAISDDGRWVAFDSSSDNLVANDVNFGYDVFLSDRMFPGFALPLAQALGGGDNGTGKTPTGYYADPVNTATGNFYTNVLDVDLPAVGVPLKFERHYNSLSPHVGALGKGWNHSFAHALTIDAATGNATYLAADGQQLVFPARPDGTFGQPPAVTATLTHSAAEFVLSFKDQRSLRFNQSGRLLRIQDRNAAGVTLTYDTEQLVSVQADNGRTLELQYNTAGLLSAVLAPLSRSVTFSYDASNRLMAVQALSGATTRYEYDATGRMTKLVDGNGHEVVANTYGPDGRIVAQQDAAGETTAFAWDAVTGTATMTDPQQAVVRHRYSGGVLVEAVDGLGRSTFYGYDGNGSVTAVTDPRGNTTRYTYDSRRNLIEALAPAPLSYTDTFVYDGSDNLVSATDGSGSTTTFEYTGSNLTAVLTADGHRTDLVREVARPSLVKEVIGPLARRTQFEYDDDGNVTGVTSPEGARRTLSYDSAGRLVGSVDPRGYEAGNSPTDFTSTFTYDAGDRLVNTRNPLGGEVTAEFDLAGNVVRRIDELSRATTYTYDAANRLTRLVAPDAAVTAYGYDTAGNLTSRTDGNGHTTTYGYDPARQLTSVTTPAGRRTEYSYDDAGNVTAVLLPHLAGAPDPADRAITAQFDALNRRSRIDYPTGTADVEFTYDGQGRRLSMVDGTGRTDYTHDPVGRLLSAAHEIKGSFSYAYDSAGRLLSRTYPDGAVTAYSRDDDDRLTSVTAEGLTTSFAYDAASNLVMTTFPTGNGHVERRSYDANNRPVDIHTVSGLLDSTLSRFQYKYDAVGNPTRVKQADGTSTRYSYDAQDRLVDTCFGSSCLLGTQLPNCPLCLPSLDGRISYTYDAVGNRTAEHRSSGSTVNTYSVDDELLSSVRNGTATNYAYDASGNRTAAGTTTYGYDAASRATTVTAPTGTWASGYDGDGARVSLTGTTTTHYAWDQLNHVPQVALETAANGTLQKRYTYGVGRVSAASASEVSFFHRDRLDSTTAMTGADGTLQRTYTYEPFGQVRSQTDLGGAENSVLFAGELQDPTGLYHLRARQYDPTSGTFLQRDPLTPALDDPYVGAYVYTNNRPTALVDPLGLSALEIVATVAGGIALGATVVFLAPVSVPIAAGAGTTALIFGGIPTGASIGNAGIECRDGLDPKCSGALADGALSVGLLGAGRALEPVLGFPS